MVYICSVCGRPDPQLFVLSETSKTPVCSEDVGRYIVQRGVIGNTIFPISAISFIGSPADIPLFEQRASSMTAATDFLTRITAEEATQWSAALQKLTTLREDLIAEIVIGIEAAKVKLNHLHGQFVEGTTSAKEEFDRGMRVKELRLSILADVVLTASKRPQEQRDFFKLTTELIVQRVKKEIATSLVTLKSEDVVEFFNKALKLPSEAPARTVSIAPPAKRPLSPPIPDSVQSNESSECDESSDSESSDTEEIESEEDASCELCSEQLTDKNSKSLSGHRACKFCFQCLESNCKLRLLCPVCKLGFVAKERVLLKNVIPEYFTRVEAYQKERILAKGKKK